MSTATLSSSALRESLVFESASVDADAGVIRGVKILGRESRNGRTYSDAALSQAARMYEGAEVNIDHPDRANPNADRKIADRFGVLENVARKGDDVFGDLQYLKTHPQAPQVAEAAQRMPRSMGLSHNAQGKVGRVNGRQVVEAIESVRSVDIVANPATNRGLFESEWTMTKTVREIVKGSKLPGVAAVMALLEQDEGAMAGMAEVPVETPAEPDSEEEVKAAFRKMVVAAFDDESLDTVATVAKIKEILKAYDKLTGTEEKTSDNGGDADKEKTVAESLVVKQLQEQVTALTAERDQAKAYAEAKRLLESAGREPTDFRIKAVCALKGEAERKKLIEEFPAKAGPRPARSAPLVESEAAKDSKQLVSLITR